MSLDPLVAFHNAAKANNCFKLRTMLIHGDAASRITGAEFLDDVDQFGNTALMFAAANGHYEACKLLLEFGANIDHKNNQLGGRKPLDYVHESYTEECPALNRLVKLLEQATQDAAEAAARKALEIESREFESSLNLDNDELPASDGGSRQSSRPSSSQPKLSAKELKKQRKVAKAAPSPVLPKNPIPITCAACRAEKHKQEISDHYSTAAAGVNSKGEPFLEPFRWFEVQPLEQSATCSACSKREQDLHDYFANSPLACNTIVVPNASGKLMTKPGCGQVFKSPALLYEHQGHAARDCPAHPLYQKPASANNAVKGKSLMSLFGTKASSSITEELPTGETNQLGSGNGGTTPSTGAPSASNTPTLPQLVSAESTPMADEGENTTKKSNAKSSMRMPSFSFRRNSKQ